MTRRIRAIMQKFYRIVSPQEIKRRKFQNYKRLAWFCIKRAEETMDITWDEAEEAAALMLDEVDNV